MTSVIEHFSDFFDGDRSFYWKNGALSWSLFVGKQKHNIQKPTFFCFFTFLHSYVLTGTEKGMRQTFGTTCHGAVSDVYD